MKSCIAAIALSIGAVLGANAQETLYVATGSNGVAGNLYTVDPATAVSTLVGPIVNVSGGGGLGITGLAFDPLNGALYGITGGAHSPTGNTLASTLVTIDPVTGNATVIGSLGTKLADISFSANGTLYGFNGGISPFSLTTINLTTGAATQVGPSGYTSVIGGGLAFSPTATLYVSAKDINGTTGTIDTVDPLTGGVTTGPVLTNRPFGVALNALAFNAAGILYGNITDSGSPATVDLVTIDPATGAIGDIGRLPGNSDALAFSVAIVPEPATWVLVGIGAGVLLLAKNPRLWRNVEG